MWISAFFALIGGLIIKFVPNESWLGYIFLAIAACLGIYFDNEEEERKKAAEQAEEQERLSNERKKREHEEFMRRRQEMLNQHEAEKRKKEQAIKKQQDEEERKRKILKEQETQRKKEEADRRKEEEKQKLDETAGPEELRIKKEEAKRKKEQERINLDLLEFETEFSRRIETLVLNSPNGFTFNHIKTVNSTFINSYGNDERDRLHRELKSGVEIIQTEKHLTMYLSAYGNMHQAKLMEAYEAIGDWSSIIKGKKIQIIDYGCGQGIGSILFMDFLKSSFSKVNTYDISKITLIEPSKIAIKRAHMLVNFSLKSHSIEPNIFVSNKMLNEVSIEELENKHANVKFHIFSNILDVESINIHDIFEKVEKSMSGDNIFICVSPRFWNSDVSPRNIRLDTFLSLFQKRHSVQILSKRETDISRLTPFESKPWTRYERVFRINKTGSLL